MENEEPVKQDEVEQIWQNFWRPLVSDPDGCLNIRKIKEELADFHFVMQQVRQVYTYITGGNLSKPTYYANVVITEADRHYAKIHENSDD